MTYRFIAALLSANEQAQHDFHVLHIPQAVFDEGLSCIRWIWNYRDERGRYPTRKTFEQRFPDVSLPRIRSLTIPEALQPVLDASLMRGVQTALDQAKDVLNKGGKVADSVALLKSRLSDVNDFSTPFQDTRVGSASSIGALAGYKRRVLERLAGTGLTTPSPWQAYNDLVGYNDYGEHNLLAARTSLGKSWVVVEWAEHFVRMKQRVLVVTLEMPKDQLEARFEAHRYHLNYPRFRKQLLTPREMGQWVHRRREWRTDGGELILTGQESLKGAGLGPIFAKIAEHRPNVVFLDGAYLIYPEELKGSKNTNDVQRFTLISNNMKRLCVSQRILGFSVVQINRDGEAKSGDSKARLKNIYGADSWAQDADNVLILNGRRGGPTRELSLEKGRESNIGEWPITFSLSPYPNFKQTGGVTVDGEASDSSTVEFQGV